MRIKPTKTFYLQNLVTILSFLVVVSCAKKTDFTEDDLNYLKQKKEIKVAVFPYYAPYQFINESGEIDGIFIDLLKLVEKRDKIKFKKIYYNNWENLIEDAKLDKIDMILEIEKSKSREDYLSFFDPIFESELVIAQNKNIKKISGLENFGNLKMVLPSKYSIVEKLKTKYPKINISTESTDADCLKKVDNGKYDAFVAPAAVINYFIKKEKLDNVIITSKTNETYMPSFAISKKDAKLNAIFKKSLNNISESEKKDILDNWLFNLVVPFYEEKFFWVYISIIFFGFLLFFSTISLTLKSEVKKRTFELNKAKIAAEKANDFKTNLIQNISHEIRTPMNGILGFSNLLKTNHLEENDRENYVNMINKSASDLKKSISNLLDISAIETEQIELLEEFVDIDILFKDLEVKFSAIAIKKNLDFKIINQNKNSEILFKTDKIKLKKIISNIIDNAIKFTHSGFIEISYHLTQNNFTIHVKDSGIGIEDNQKEYLFESFSQLNKSNATNYGGLGLGLYFARKYVSLLKGTIQFSSEKDFGTTFTIDFSDIVTLNKIDLNEKNEKLIKPKNNLLNILIAEDVTINFLLLEKLLEKNINFDLKIERAENGQEAVKLHKESSYDIIFMDIKMPYVDGYEATEEIRKIDPEVIIIAQTAFSRDEDAYKIISNGFDDYLFKPIDINKLRFILQKYIAN